MSTPPDAPAAAPVEPEQPPRSRYGQGTVRGVVLSMLVVGAVVAVLVALVPRPTSIEQPSMDVPGNAREVARSSGIPVAQPADLPDGWRATSVRYLRSTDGVMTWHIGYLTPDGSYIALEQAADVTDAWVEAQTNRSRVDGTVQVTGSYAGTWDRYAETARQQRSILLRSTQEGGVTTLVTGKAPYDDLVAFAGRLEPTEVEGGTPSTSPTGGSSPTS